MINDENKKDVDFTAASIYLVARKALKDYLKCRKYNSGVELESFFDQWKRDNLFRVDEEFRVKVWKELLELLYEQSNNSRTED